MQGGDKVKADEFITDDLLYRLLRFFLIGEDKVGVGCNLDDAAWHTHIQYWSHNCMS